MDTKSTYNTTITHTHTVFNRGARDRYHTQHYCIEQKIYILYVSVGNLSKCYQEPDASQTNVYDCLHFEVTNTTQQQLLVGTTKIPSMHNATHKICVYC